MARTVAAHPDDAKKVDAVLARFIASGRPFSANDTRGELTGVFAWLEANVWSQGSRLETDERCRQASGGPLEPAHFKTHLETRYLA